MHNITLQGLYQKQTNQDCQFKEDDAKNEKTIKSIYRSI